MRSIRNKVRFVLPVCVTIGLIAASCSDSDDSASTSAPTTTAASTTTLTSEPPGFIFGYLRPAPGLLLEVASAQTTALDLAIDDINAAGGINGAPAGLLVVDETDDVDVSVAIDQLVDGGANVILGPVGSTAAQDALAALAARDIVACSASATTPDLTQLDTEGVFFRTVLTDPYTVDFTADKITELRDAADLPEGTPYRVLTLARSDDYGVSVGNGLTSTLLARGIEAETLSYNPRRVVFDEEAATIAAKNPDLVVLVSYGEGPAQIDALAAAGFPAKKIFGLDALFDPTLATTSFPDDPAVINGLRVIGSTGDRAFIKRLMAVPNQDQLVYGAQMYDCAISVALAASVSASTEAAAYAPQLAKVTEGGSGCSTYADCLTKVAAGEDIDYLGASGTIGFDASGDATEGRFTLAEFNDSTLQEVSSTDVNLKDIQQAEALATAVLVTRLQQVLTALRFYSGPIDGVYSPETEQAVKDLQAELGVPVTGVYDQATDEALRARYGTASATLDDAILNLQLLLTDLGLYTGPLDGVYNAQTVEAVKALQRALLVPETGFINSATLAAAYAAGLRNGTPPPSVPATTVRPVTTTGAPVTTVAPSATVAPPNPPLPTLLQLLSADPRFTTFVDLLVRAGFNGDVTAVGPLTVFAPTNAAFAKLTPGELSTLTADPEILMSVLSYHAAEGGYTVQSLTTFTTIPTVHGEPVAITSNGSVVMVNDARVEGNELVASNGFVIVIDKVLRPPTLLPG